MDSSVQLRTKNLRVFENTRESLELAVLSGSILILLGDDDTVGPRLADILAGRKQPFQGSVLIGQNQTDVTHHQSRIMMGFTHSGFSCPDGMTVSQCISLACSAAGFSRKETPEVISQLLNWCSLLEYRDEKVEELDFAHRFLTGFAAACLPVPEVLVMRGVLPPQVHPLMEDLCSNGCSVIASVPGVEYIPVSAERVAICDSTGVSRILRQSELADVVSQLMRIKVAFYPVLPRAVMESLSGAGDIMSIDGGFEFHHSNLSAAVTNLVNLARANSRQISALHIRAPSCDELSRQLGNEDEESEADLFAES